jgi:hypothetical protein
VLPAVLQCCRWLTTLHLRGGLGPAPEYTAALVAFLQEGTALKRLRVHMMSESVQAMHQIPLLRRGVRSALHAPSVFLNSARAARTLDAMVDVWQVGGLGCFLTQPSKLL